MESYDERQARESRNHISGQIAETEDQLERIEDALKLIAKAVLVGSGNMTKGELEMLQEFIDS